MKTLEQKVMARVRRIYYLRKITSPTALELYAFIGALFGLLSLVSVTNVVANMPSPLSPLPFITFLSTAFRHTELVVQVLFTAVCAASILLVYEFVKSLRGEQLRFS